MFKKSVIISLSIFFILMIITSIVKNNTRNIEKLGGEVSTLEKELADAKIDFIYLSTPERLQKKITDLSKIKYFSYDHSSIFLSTEDFIRHTSQETKKFKIKK